MVQTFQKALLPISELPICHNRIGQYQLQLQHRRWKRHNIHPHIEHAGNG